MDNEIKSKLNNKYNLSSEDYEMISARIDELRKAIEDVIEFEEKNKLSNKKKYYQNLNDNYHYKYFDMVRMRDYELL